MERKRNDAYMVKDTKEARMAFIGIINSILQNKDEEHLRKYESLWSEHIDDADAFACKYYHNLTKDEFQDFVMIIGLASINKKTIK